MYETVIIFDWDDTILCTSFINPTGVFNPHARISPAVYKQLEVLDAVAVKALELSVKYGQTYIITNAGEGWVQFSAQKFMPSCVEILKKIKELDQVKEAIPSAKQDAKKGPVQVKPICLIMGYMYGIIEKKDLLENEGIAKDLEIILRTVPSYFDIMLQQIMMMSQMYKMGRSPKKITARNIMTIIQFSQNLMQCGWKSKDPYAQLPGFGDDECKKIKGIMNGKNLY